MRRWLRSVVAVAGAGLVACTPTNPQGTIAELERVEASIDDVYLDDGLERAAQSYRRYLAETAEGPLTPEAMRRLADLQLEQEYGVLGSGGSPVEMAAPQSATPAARAPSSARRSATGETGESLEDFERRATSRSTLLSAATTAGAPLPDMPAGDVPAGPREAIAIYWKILETYPYFERNDQVLYQLSRAYDEIGDPDQAMAVMERLVAQFPHSKYVDEVYFRRGENLFVRKHYRQAEAEYGAVIDMGSTSRYYELALYKLGWTLYKQDFYEEALHRYMAMLDHRLSTGYDFDKAAEDEDEHRVADTFRVISLSFSNLGGPEVVDEYFSEHGHRSFAAKIYGNLGEFFFGKLRYDDAASVYKSFVKLNPLHTESPHFSMRVIEIYHEAGFPKLVVQAKKAFATDYALDAEYWRHFDVEQSPEVVGFLKANLTDLARHFHALYQDDTLQDDRGDNLTAAQHWYRQFLQSFPTDTEAPQINYQLADLLLEDEAYSVAAGEYERTAYGYGAHDQAAAAGYAAIYAHRKNLDASTETQRPAAMIATVESSLRLAEAFPEHEQAPVVLGAAADDLYSMNDHARAISAARTLVDRYPESDAALRRSAWAVIAHSSIDLAEYRDAELAYVNVLELTATDDESRPDVIDGLAAAIYKQGEAAREQADYQAAADHFLRIKAVAPDSAIRSAAEYDAAAALIELESWSMASGVLEAFRTDHPDHELGSEATRQLAFVYRENGQLERSAAEHERVAAEAETTDPELSREALLTAGELYDEVAHFDDAVRVYRRYVAMYPMPLDIAMDTRSRLADIYKDRAEIEQYHAQLRDMVAVDRDAGAERTDRSRYLAAHAGLVLAELDYERFAGIDLVQPFDVNLARKQQEMDTALTALEGLVDYEVAEVTAAATYYLAETYMNFSDALLNSERPVGLAAADLADYEMVLEDEAFPFEEQAIEVHEANFELFASGIHNAWVQNSLDKLSVLMPGRYAKSELSSGYVGSLDTYAYRMPIAPPPGADGTTDPVAVADTEVPAETSAESVQASTDPVGDSE